MGYPLQEWEIPVYAGDGRDTLLASRHKLVILPRKTVQARGNSKGTQARVMDWTPSEYQTIEDKILELMSMGWSTMELADLGRDRFMAHSRTLDDALESERTKEKTG